VSRDELARVTSPAATAHLRRKCEGSALMTAINGQPDASAFMWINLTTGITSSGQTNRSAPSRTTDDSLRALIHPAAAKSAFVL
jgi:hypothetical protein